MALTELNLVEREIGDFTFFRGTVPDHLIELFGPIMSDDVLSPEEKSWRWEIIPFTAPNPIAVGYVPDKESAIIAITAALIARGIV